MNQPSYLDIPTDFPPGFASAYGQDTKGYWLELNLFNQTVRFRWIPKGQFMMGSDEQEKGRYNDEDQHLVILSKGLWLAETTVTQALWQAAREENPSKFQEGETSVFPVENVSWDEAQSFIAKLNKIDSDFKFRLPWEAEWEYACRAGTDTPFNFEGELKLDKVNYSGTWDDYDKWEKGAKKSTVEVKSYPSNVWGLYEMHGNVWEWCEDNWQEHLATQAVTDPWVSAEKKQAELGVSTYRVLRGGSWSSYGRNVRSAFRLGSRSGERDGNVGFRLSLGL